MNDLFGAIEFLKQEGAGLLSRFVRSRRGAVYAELRFEAGFSRSCVANDGELRDSSENQTAGFGVAVHFAAAGSSASGHCGAEIGRLALQPKKLVAAIRDALEEAAQRAGFNAHERALILKRYGAKARSLAQALETPTSAEQGEVAAQFRHDPRTLAPAELTRLCREASIAVKAIGPQIVYNVVAATAELRHELFINTSGAQISQQFAYSQGDCYVVAQDGDGYQESWDTLGHQRGFEYLAAAYADELMPGPGLMEFALDLGREARQLAAAPVLKPPAGEVTVVTDPHFNALVAHEIVGHPSEADRALKMEAAYAGRSWFLRSLAANEIGRPIGSPLLWACSDPTLEGYGHYQYDHEGTPGRRTVHIEGGVFRGFINSRTTAAALGAEPNGSARASEAYHVPLIRMSNTFFLPGEQAPGAIIAEVDHGYYVCGNLTPSIAESRENFRISARKVYEIDRGRLGRLYRAGSVMGDSKRFFMNVDAVGNDLRLIAIPNCGKGQPMQVKRMSNGGPTLRSRAFLGGG